MPALPPHDPSRRKYHARMMMRAAWVAIIHLQRELPRNQLVATLPSIVMGRKGCGLTQTAPALLFSSRTGLGLRVTVTSIIEVLFGPSLE